MIGLRVRRLFCDNSDCGRKTFTEPVPGVAPRYARRTTGLHQVLDAVGLALGGRAGARLTRQLAATVSRMTLLRQIRAMPDPEHATTRVLGVDDFALRRGHRYGTILIDLETRRPIDVLADRTSATLTAWLRAHPGAEVICRDRAGAYADAAATGAPGAVQVADRWHLWHNLAEAVERTVTRHARALNRTNETVSQEVSPPADSGPLQHQSAATAATVEGRVAQRIRHRHNAVHSLLSQGVGIRAISLRLGLARATVRRLARASTPDELIRDSAGKQRPSVLDEFKPYLLHRWNEGCTNTPELLAEIRARGYRGSRTILFNFLQPLGTGERTPRIPAKPLSVRRFVTWLMSDPAALDPDDRQRLDTVLDASLELTALAGHVRAFAVMMRERQGGDLDTWMTAVESDDLPALRSFVRGLRRDYDAVRAGLTLPWSSGTVEGHVNRVKMLKQQMFGRANPDLLRKRILLSN
ncbi:ISL3 family transposase [Nocardia transvalensis]|uniref:ISL3 family transposase n=1 Tax=Nocardia transvalensis TaxID=37333 RepID=UPI002B4B7D70|nr:ISL3 family transposase [Nocardia transvalensis]